MGWFFLEEGDIVLTENGSSTRVKNQPKTQSVAGSWQLTFPPNWGAPDSVTLPELISWSEAPDQGIRYFSGTATYHQRFRFDPKDTVGYDRVTLDLGNLSEVAEVWLNDQPLGITWSKPYTFEITDRLKKGENTLKIEVANTWSNRLVGDATTGEKFTETNIATAYRDTPWKEAPLLESGLLGPVTLRFTKTMPY